MDQRLSVALLLLGLTVLVDGQTVAAPFTGNITRNGCGATKFCIETPTGCDPATSGNCLFASTAIDTTSATGISFNLQGNSSGYIAAILTTAGNSTGDAFVCAQNAGDTLFYHTVYSSNGSSLIPNIFNNTVYNVTGSANNNIISCTFVARNLTISNGKATTLYNISLAVGDFTDGTLRAPDVRLQTQRKLVLSLYSASAPALTAVDGMLILVSGLIFGMY
ncbi:putative ferric-chelate reductase 1 [Lepisosteus oculatus]|uniref:putative ferric-chelate reductase 1 n=1 Tax=Lepisosteus oculatus TaxID=7918 RepID=UPI0037249A90